jgi:hypothetical protein
LREIGNEGRGEEGMKYGREGAVVVVVWTVKN